MGRHFGNLIKMRGIITFKLSPYEQNPLAGIISHGFPNMIRRIRDQIFYIGPPTLAAYLLFDWAEKDHARRQRKDPEKYCDDE